MKPKVEGKTSVKRDNDENGSQEEAAKDEPVDPEVLARTVHMKGFDFGANEEAIRKFIEQYGKVEALEMLKKQGSEDFRVGS